MNGNWCAALFPDPIQPLLSQGWLASQPGNTITIAVQTEISSARIVVFKIFANQLWKLNWREKWRRSFDNLGFCISSPKQTIENDGKFANNSTTVDICSDVTSCFILLHLYYLLFLLWEQHWAATLAYFQMANTPDFLALRVDSTSSFRHSLRQSGNPWELKMDKTTEMLFLAIFSSDHDQCHWPPPFIQTLVSLTQFHPLYPKVHVWCQNKKWWPKQFIINQIH